MIIPFGVRCCFAALGFFVLGLTSACDEGISCTGEERGTVLRVVDENGDPVTPTEVVVRNAKGRVVELVPENAEESAFIIPESGGGTYSIRVEYCDRSFETTGEWTADECHADGPPGGVTVDVGQPCAE